MNAAIWPLGFCVVILSACTQPGIPQPVDAPPPESPDQILIDAQGCNWWVIGNASNLSWAPRINSTGDHICDSSPQNLPVDDASTASAAAPVVSESPPAPVAEITPAIAPSVSSGTFRVQVATFGNRDNAQASVNAFRAMGIPVASGTSAGSDGFFRLVLGPFDSAAAQDALDRARAKGFSDAFIMSR